MESFRGLHDDRGTAGHFHSPDSALVYLCVLSHPGVSDHHLYDPGFLDKHEKLYRNVPPQPFALVATPFLFANRRTFAPSDGLKIPDYACTS